MFKNRHKDNRYSASLYLAFYSKLTDEELDSWNWTGAAEYNIFILISIANSLYNITWLLSKSNNLLWTRRLKTVLIRPRRSNFSCDGFFNENKRLWWSCGIAAHLRFISINSLNDSAVVVSNDVCPDVIEKFVCISKALHCNLNTECLLFCE